MCIIFYLIFDTGPMYNLHTLTVLARHLDQALQRVHFLSFPFSLTLFLLLSREQVSNIGIALGWRVQEITVPDLSGLRGFWWSSQKLRQRDRCSVVWEPVHDELKDVGVGQPPVRGVRQTRNDQQYVGARGLAVICTKWKSPLLFECNKIYYWWMLTQSW